MKKIIIALITVLITLSVAVSCGTPAENAYFYVKDGDSVKKFDVNVNDFESGATVYTVLTSDKYADAFNADINDGGTYIFLDGICNIKPTETGAFIAIYTSLVHIEGDDAVYSTTEYGTCKVENLTLGSASYGISELPLVKGETYLFTVEVYKA